MPQHSSTASRVLLLTILFGIGTAAIASADAKLDAQLLAQCGYGNVEEARDLLNRGADATATNESGISALHLAAREGNVRLIRLLLENGAKVNVKNRSGDTPLKEAVSSPSADAVAELLAAGAEPDPKVLALACGLGRLDAVRLLLKTGVSPNAGLPRAAQSGHVELVKLLLGSGANVNGQTESGNTALHLAALQGGLETVQVLIDNGADPNSRNKDDETPLHSAIKGDGDIKRVQLLVESGAALNLANREGITPVRLASIRSAAEVYSWLLATNEGTEPVAALRDEAASTEPLIDDLSSNNRETRIAAQRELVARGKVIMPDVLRRLETGAGIEHFYEFFQAMGPQADAALPQLIAQLSNKNQVFGAAITIERMKPGGIAQLSDEAKQRAADALYETLVDPEIDVAAEMHSRLLIALGEPAMPTILRLLRHELPGIRAFVARQLEGAMFYDKALHDELVGLLRGDPHSEVRACAARALANPKYHSPVAKEALWEALRTPPIAIESFPPQAGQEREAAFARKREVDRLLESAASSLSTYGPNVIDELLPLIRQEDDPSWAQYRKVWGHLGPDVVPVLAKLLDDRDEHVRHIAHEELGRLAASSEEALGILASRLSSSNAGQRQLAADAVWELRGPASRQIRTRLLSLLNDDEVDLRTRILLLKSALRSDTSQTASSDEFHEFLPRLIVLATEGEYLDRVLAIEALGDSGSAAIGARSVLERLSGQELPALPDGPRPRVGEESSPEWKAAMTKRSQAQMIRQLAAESLKRIIQKQEEFE